MIRSIVLILGTIAALLFATPSESDAASRTTPAVRECQTLATATYTGWQGWSYDACLEAMRQPYIAKRIPQVATKQAMREPYMLRMVNCEDYDIQPCYTYDEGAYRMVYSYSPYKAVKLTKCTAEDGGKVLPCIWKHNNKVKKGQPVTRNVFTKNG